MTLIVWVHNLVYRLVFGLVRLTLSLVWRWVLVVVALLSEEVRRYAGLALSGAIIVLMGKLFLVVPVPEPVRRWLVLSLLVVLAIWAMAVRRAVRYTRHNNLYRMRQKKSVRDLHEKVGDIQGRVNEGLARRARGTPLEGAWSANRSARAEEQAAAQRAAERAEEKAKRDRVARETTDRELDRLAELEPDPFK